MSALSQLASKPYTAEEFFDLLERTGEKYEFEAGAVRLMAGGTYDHNAIKTDVAVNLGSHALQHGSCEPFDSDQAVFIPDHATYVFPDLSFVCDEAQFEDEARRRLLNPALLIEVLSESTETYDRGDKFRKYRSLPSFREYILIDSRRYLVECFYKENNKLWHIDSCVDPYGSVYIHTLTTHLPLSVMYRRVKF